MVVNPERVGELNDESLANSFRVLLKFFEVSTQG
jgi:hypothetical protein